MFQKRKQYLDQFRKFDSGSIPKETLDKFSYVFEKEMAEEGIKRIDTLSDILGIYLNRNITTSKINITMQCLTLYGRALFLPYFNSWKEEKNRLRPLNYAVLHRSIN